MASGKHARDLQPESPSPEGEGAQQRIPRHAAGTERYSRENYGSHRREPDKDGALRAGAHARRAEATAVNAPDADASPSRGLQGRHASRGEAFPGRDAQARQGGYAGQGRHAGREAHVPQGTHSPQATTASHDGSGAADAYARQQAPTQRTSRVQQDAYARQDAYAPQDASARTDAYASYAPPAREDAYARPLRQASDATAVQPRTAPSSSDYAPYGARTAHSAEYSEWAGRADAQDFAIPRSRAGSVAGSVAKALLAVVLVGIIAACGAVFWYLHQLDSILSEQERLEGSAEQVLTEAKAGEPFYVLVLGSDSREDGTTDVQFSDVIMLLRVDLPHRKLTMVSIPRDTPWVQPDGSRVKLNSAYITGAATSVEAVSELAGVPISHYMEANISDVEKIVDILGGVKVDVPVPMTVTDVTTEQDINLEAGTQNLDGLQTQAFVRARHELENGETGRQGHVREVVAAMVESLIGRPWNEIPGLVLELAPFLHTDLRSGDFINMLIDYLTSSEQNMTVYSASAPSDGQVFEEYDGSWLCYDNPEGWAELMRRVDAGEDPSGIDYESTQIVP